ncbi:hypothetical protein CEXT_606451 [Caerostris extrusa]|uniref:Uncharacterized protein n=1 Tax=Caerostris extrusa TaxID=172846 RepID=A0AAV4N9P5_CAEEX|nr:hypothetical protein CEXT_606451 [Caerostris extrusa]
MLLHHENTQEQPAHFQMMVSSIQDWENILWHAAHYTAVVFLATTLMALLQSLAVMEPSVKSLCVKYHFWQHIFVWSSHLCIKAFETCCLKQQKLCWYQQNHFNGKKLHSIMVAFDTCRFNGNKAEIKDGAFMGIMFIQAPDKFNCIP